MSVQWTGLAEFKAELHNLPERLKDEAAQIVIAAATDVQRDVQAAYPARTGALKRGVRMKVESAAKLGAKAVVRSAAPHAHIYERGTKIRTTDSGANRGRMPEAPESQQMIPIAIRARRRMVQALIALVQSMGLEVAA